ncbi:hypothetical protein BFR40_02490 [Brochothrix thermosphacta]|uniref:cell division protein FtsQ/DivIB n=1 Tax=Brochothrix thermosphacta TaxID=2756 RepID=UPI00083FC756|nr:FtsQ-type POTRA domain-containing protein [Brochothrix thermosphacta]ODJ53505.1 hypothetical protein BFR40_02490 [Brochothrix thermosphacta]
MSGPKQTKVVSIEDKIPELKKYKEKVRKRKLYSLLASFFFLILIVLFFISPFSRVDEVKIVDNKRLAKEDVVKLSGIGPQESIFKIKTAKVKKTLEKSPLIESVKINRKGINDYEIKVVESQPVAYMSTKKGYIPLLETGYLDESDVTKYPLGNAPILIGFENNTKVLSELGKQLEKTSSEIRNSMSEIIFKPESLNKKRLNVYMNDGFKVVIAINKFAENFKIYPSIIGQVKDGSTGVIDLEVGAFYQSYYNENKKISKKEPN